jgi:hypothetical protein
MFLASIGKPYIGLHKQIHWDVAMYALDVSTEGRARAVAREICGGKDPTVARKLLEDNRKEGEYFEITLHQVQSRYHAVRIPEPSTGLPRPNVSYWI